MELSREPQQLMPSVASAALDAVDNMLVITDRDGQIVYVNQAFTHVTGYTFAEAVGQNPRMLQSGAQDDAFYAQLWAKILRGEPWTGELVNRKKSGELYTDHMSITALKDVTGEITHFVAVKRDISNHLAALAAGSPGGIAHTDYSGRLVYANTRLTELLGTRFESLLGDGWFAALGHTAADQVRNDLARLARTRDVVSVIELLDGRSLRVHYAPLLLGGNGQAGVVATMEDITVEQGALHQLRQREAYARAILESLGTPTAVVSATGVIREVNRAWRENAEALNTPAETVGRGVNYREVCQRSIADGSTDAQRALDALDAVLAGNSQLEMLDYYMDGFWWELRISALGVDEGGAILAHTDVTWRHQVQQLLDTQAHTDPLTKLANRPGLLRLGADAMARARRSGNPVTVAFIDLDDFKPVNDRLGHEAGDEVLQFTAKRLQETVREVDAVARVGGDEFVLVCEDLDAADLTGFRNRIREALRAPITLSTGDVVAVDAAIGAVQVAGTGDLAKAIADADEQMYAVKRTQKT